MYTMQADGVLFHNPNSNDSSCMAVGTEATFELNKPGSLVFTLPPENVVYHALRKRKSIVSLFQDGELLFRGRVIETTTDLYNMQEVYCEGELSLLMDSVQPAMEFEGTAEEYLRQAISNHNSLMEFDKRFAVGDVTAVNSKHKVKIKTTEYTETLGDLQSLLVKEFGGYLRVRYSGGTRYLDYIKEYTNYSGQSVKFGVNLVDIEKRVDTQKFFTVLLPLGKIEKGKRTTIADANGGSIYLEDASAVAEYGKIVQVETFDNVNDPEELLEKAQEFLARMRENRSITIKAVDMKIVNPDEDNILLGDRVMLDSFPHDLNEPDICAKVVLLIDTPDQSEYTFGLPPDPLTDQIANRIKKINGYTDKLREWLTVTDYELTLAKQYVEENGEAINNVMIRLDAINSTIELKADRTEVTDLSTRLSSAEIKIDGLEAEIKLIATESSVTELKTQVSQAMIRLDGAEAAIELKADRTTVDDLGERLSQAEIDIDGANAAISLKASKTVVDDLGERVSSAELLIDGQNSKIEAKADLILLDGYVKTTELEAEVLKVLQYADLSQADLDVGYLDASDAQIATLDSNSITTNSLTVGGEQLGSASLTMGPTTATLFAPSDINLAHSHAVTVDGGKVTLGEVSSTGGSFNMADTTFFKDAVSAAKKDGQDEGYELGYADAKPTGLIIKSSTYNSSNGFYSVDVEVLTADEQGYHYFIGVNAESAYNAGYAGAAVETISVGSSNYNSANKMYSFTVTVTAADGTKTEKSFGISAQAAYDAGYNAGYNAGYSAGQEAGGSTSVEISNTSIGSDNKLTVYAVDTSSGLILANKTIDVSSVYNKGVNSVTLSASGWVSNVNTISASNGQSMKVTRAYSSANVVSNGDSVFVSYNGAMVNATYKSGGSKLTYISSVTVKQGGDG